MTATALASSESAEPASATCKTVSASAPSPASPLQSPAPASSLQTLSQRLWDLDWSAELPWSCGAITVEQGTFEEAATFVAAHYEAIFGLAANGFYVDLSTSAKARFWREMDVFVFRADDRVIGICAAHPTDWSTYYVRTFAILPEFREQGFLSEFQSLLHEALTRAPDIARWEIECSPANTPMLRLVTRAGFVQTGMVNTERWGTMLRFTRFTKPAAAKTFTHQFLNVPTFERRDDQKRNGDQPKEEERRTP